MKLIYSIRIDYLPLSNDERGIRYRVRGYDGTESSVYPSTDTSFLTPDLIGQRIVGRLRRRNYPLR